MPDLQTDRAYRTMLRRIGSKLKTGLSWRDSIQPVALVDTLGHLMQPTDNRIVWLRFVRTATPTVHSVGTILAGRGGFWFRGWWQITVQTSLMETRANPPSGSMSISVLPGAARFGDTVSPLELQAATGTRAPGAPSIYAPQPALYASSEPRLYVPPGWCWECVSPSANQAMDIVVLVEELAVE